MLDIHQIVHDPYEEEEFAVVDNFNRRITSFALGAEGCRRVGADGEYRIATMEPVLPGR